MQASENKKDYYFLGVAVYIPKMLNSRLKKKYLLNNSLEPTNEWYAIIKISGIKLCQAMRMQ